MAEDLKQAALEYHEHPVPGKLSVTITKSTETARDLSLAYSPGVAEPCREIAKDPETAYRYTGKGNLVAVISDGSAILGLGNLGPLASKPVMEGKGVLFKRFAGVNSVDVEVESESPQAFIDTVARIANTYGGINLEDIKAPECFEIERQLIEKCSIPVFHDDQHGTAIVTAAGLLNALELQGKDIATAKIVCLGAGAAATACMKLIISCGAQRENIYVLDRKGVIHSGRDDLNQYKAMFAIDTDKRTLDDAIDGADVFIGVSGPNLLSAEQLTKMAANPVVFACSNPDPEISPELAHATRDDLIMATGRSDYPNQVNNVLGFPFIFRGALDVRATKINEEMKVAAVHALKDLAKEPAPADVIEAYNGEVMEFGKAYILPKPLDSRLLTVVSGAVAQAAVDSGVASLPYPDFYPLTDLERF
ncbi:MAG: malic enzyme-like NAD(P)-binding protein [Marinomonas sp.]|jgi:malate dehydrogenase (oxaloacetate-decarboxylating)(NADP+)|uniref:malic enzyme-like NAD(P)-binding protein n=1 Tax=unclassified Marinomonas TaxID=196814 RepID=UPI0005FA04E1|nr:MULTISPECIES: malic enzyme-like NAD(P)-binding protein [unclassified Marinomonas]KJZ15366.1 malate dehydrogenase [Marinomonas sp. S3726]KZM39725.1 malate dehydrogenase [Marinomonas sp. SBI22]KZM41101.1 malate dehydrogenase [Marinomonas sp. SBI8L]